MIIIMMAIANKRKKTAIKTKPTSSKLDPEPVWNKQVPRHTMKLKASCSIQGLPEEECIIRTLTCWQASAQH